MNDFRQTVGNRYRSMQQRVRKFYGLNVPLPFSADRFEEWVLIQLGGPEGHTLCTYCRQPIHFENMVADHRIPLEQAGSLELDNLVPACPACNQQKGAMLPLAFSALRELGLNREIFTETDWDSVRGRLQSALKLAKREQARIKAIKKAETVRIVPHQRRAG